MAIFSSHLLDATNGSHAGNIDVIIYQIKENGDKEIFFESKIIKYFANKADQFKFGWMLVYKKCLSSFPKF